MAAGVGKRIYPITLVTPKPPVKVNGIKMIDTVIRGLKRNEIYVVVGYLKVQFYVLEKEYGVKSIEAFIISVIIFLLYTLQEIMKLMSG